MRQENCFFEVFPRIVPADAEMTISIRPLFDHARFDPNLSYEVSYFPTEEFSERSGWPLNSHPETRIDSGVLHIRQYFEGEQEHVLLVESVCGGKRTRVGSFRVYSLLEDLMARRPFRGDLHIHSSFSDGRESPAYVAGACRRIGLDFMAVTDHRRYAPSIQARQAYAGVPIDLRIYPGEEVHPPGNPVHIVNFGGAFSVSDLMADKDAHVAEISALADTLGQLPPGVDPYQYASCKWTFDKIRQAGGLGIFAHPYWFYPHQYTPGGPLTSLLLKEQPFDALELIGGFFRYEAESNLLQVARYHQERAEGRQLPIVGSSDSHGCERGELFGWYSTIAFARSSDLPDLIESVKSLYSVAVETLPGEMPRVHGPFRLVKFSLYLLREYFPLHDELCREEGRLMLAHASGNAQAAESLKSLAGRTAALMEHCWATCG